MMFLIFLILSLALAQDCSPGMHLFQNTTCVPCFAGFYQPNAGQTGCLPCASGTTSHSNASVCTDCTPGRFATAQSASCTLCPLGRYTDQKAASSCDACEVDARPTSDRTSCVPQGTPCGAGAYQMGSYCYECTPGRASNVANTTQCTVCSPGFYSRAGQSECTLCPDGTTSTAGAGGCVDIPDCPPGSHYDRTEQPTDVTACDECFAGFYQSDIGQMNCDQCPSGKFSLAGSATCTDCGPGYFAPAGAWSCSLCPSGAYSPNGNASSCLMCGNGQKSTGNRTTCISADAPCGPGSYSYNSNGCLQCPSGRASSLMDATTLAACIYCESGYYANSGASECTICPAGTISAPGARLCYNSSDCSPGTYFNPGGLNGTCLSCQPGFYQAQIGQNGCDACPAGTSSISGAAACFACSSGYFAPLPSSLACSQCPFGQFANTSGSTNCSDCPDNTRPSPQRNMCVSNDLPCGEGAYRVGVECLLCPAGSASNAQETTSCNLCHAGYYATRGQSTCTMCPNGTTSNPGASQCFHTPDCLPGSHWMISSYSCIPCFAGFYQPQLGQTNCIACPPGTAAPANSTSCPSCTPGYFAAQSASSQCSLCPAFQYTSKTAATSCLQCTSGTRPDSARVTCVNISLPCGAGAYRMSDGECAQCPTGRANSAMESNYCSVCQPGFVAPHGGVTCTQCPNGKTSNLSSNVCFDIPACVVGEHYIEAQSHCAKCFAGFYQNETGQRDCDQCKAGRYSIAGSSTCTDCQPGYFSGDANGACSLCPIGRFANSSIATRCDFCPTGTRTDASRTFCVPQGTPCGEGAFQVNGQCYQCSPGRYSDTQDATACQSCVPGFYALKGASYCSECPIGKTSILQAQSCVDIPDCPAGTHFVLESISCVECDPGFYQNETGQMDCSVCPPGTSSSANSSECTACPPGSFASTTPAPFCSLCPDGTYNRETGSSFCSQCQSGSRSNAERTACVPTDWQCGAGAYRSGSDCRLCEPGTASDESETSFCPICSAGFYAANSGQTSCDQCPSGTTSLVGSQNCTTIPDCPAGTHYNAGRLICVACFAGFYQPDIGQTDCDQCEPGRYSAPNSSSCDACQSGYFSENAAQTCSLCPNGRYTRAAGSTTCNQCTSGTKSTAQRTDCVDIGTPCGPGAFEALNNCFLCAPGTANSLDNATQCSDCLPGYYSSAPGQATCSTCPSGTTSNSRAASCFNPPNCSPGTHATSNTTCTPCAAGFYQAQTGQLTCDQCAPGQYSSLNSSSCSDCNPGFYAPIANASCSFCPVGKISSNSGSSTCFDCGINMRSNENGTACEPTTSPCLAGSYRVGGECYVCPAGRFTNTPNEALCYACSAGSSSTSGQTTCTQCPQGQTSQSGGECMDIPDCPMGSHFVTSSVTCVQCFAGFYQPLSGQVDCLACAKGKASTNAGARSCADCLPGYFAPQSSSSRCSICQAGRYSPNIGASTCEQCPNNTRSTYPRSSCVSIDTPCGAGFYRVSPTTCMQCPMGRANSLDEASSCIACPNGTNVERTLCLNTTTKWDCVAGQYWNTNQKVCVLCAPGSANSIDYYATSCESCPAGFFASNTGSIECTACEAGYYSNITGGIDCSPCSSLTYSLNGSSNCQSCPVDQIPNQDNSGCVNANLNTTCLPGSWFNSASRECQSCDAGTYQSQSGSISCELCPPGKVAKASGAESCEACGSGEYAALSGLSACVACTPGTFSNSTASTGCELCPPGSYTDMDRATVCVLCPAGFANPLTGATLCTSCPEGYKTKVEGSTDCLQTSQDDTISTSHMCSGEWCNVAVITAAVTSAVLVMCCALIVCNYCRKRRNGNQVAFTSLSRAGSPVSTKSRNEESTQRNDNLDGSNPKHGPLKNDSPDTPKSTLQLQGDNKNSLELSTILKGRTGAETPDDLSDQSFRSTAHLNTATVPETVPEHDTSDDSDHHVDVHTAVRKPLTKKNYPKKKVPAGLKPLRHSTSQENLF